MPSSSRMLHALHRSSVWRRRPGVVISVVVSLIASSGVIALMGTADAKTPVLTLKTVVTTNQWSASKTIRSHAVYTASPELLTALIATDSAHGGTALKTVYGCGLSWKRVVRANGKPGLVEIWSAKASSRLHGCHVFAVRSSGAYTGQMTILGFTGAAGIGAKAASSGINTASVSLRTKRANSLVIAVGNDWDRKAKRQLPSGQKLLSQYLAPRGNTYWSQSRTRKVASPSRVTLSVKSPIGDRFNMAAVEIMGAPASSATETSTSTATSSSHSATASSTPSTTHTSSSSASATPTTTPTASSTPTKTSTPTPSSTATTDPTATCPAYPAFPDENCTGWRHTGVTLTSVKVGDSGPGWHTDTVGGTPFFYVDTAGTVVDGKDINMCVAVMANNVTIKRSRIRCADYYVIRTMDGSKQFSGLTLTDDELDGLDQAGSQSIAVMETANATYTRLDIHGMASSGPRLGTGNTIQDSYIHDFVCQKPDHTAGMSANGGGTNITLLHNNIDIDQRSGCATAAWELAKDFGTYNGVLTEKNLFNGGAYCAYFAATPDPGSKYSPAVNVKVIDNVFGRKYAPACGGFGPVAQYTGGNGNQWTNNTWGPGAYADSSHKVGDPVNP